MAMGVGSGGERRLPVHNLLGEKKIYFLFRDRCARGTFDIIQPAIKDIACYIPIYDCREV